MSTPVTGVPTPPVVAEEIDLTPYVDAIATALIDGTPVAIATSSPDGSPDVAFKGSLMVWDRDHLAYWERSFKETLAALRAGKGGIATLYRNQDRGFPVPVRFYGEVEQLVESGDLREQVWERVNDVEKGRDPEKKGIAVIFRVDRIKRGQAVVAERPRE